MELKILVLIAVFKREADFHWRLVFFGSHPMRFDGLSSMQSWTSDHAIITLRKVFLCSEGGCECSPVPLDTWDPACQGPLRFFVFQVK